MDLTDEQWDILRPLIPKPRRRADGRGRPWRDDREVLNGILWILRTGAQWHDMPDRYPSPATCHRRFQHWVRTGVLKRILRALAKDLRDRGKLDLSEGFIDGTFAGAKKGGSVWVPPSGARVRRSWQWQTAMVFLSPLTWPALRLMKSNSSAPRSRPASSRKPPSGSSATRPTTVMRSERSSGNRGSS
jgi:transposase